MAAKFNKVKVMSVEELGKKLSSEGRNSKHWNHMFREIKIRAADTHNLTREGYASKAEAKKVLEKLVPVS